MSPIIKTQAKTQTVTEKIIKYTFIVLSLFIHQVLVAQSDFPDFLQGTWKADNKELYEHWDKLNDQKLKGFSYTLDKGNIIVTEYLEISQQGKDITYTATVVRQNQGKPIHFKLTRTDSTYTFQNPDHDFPKKIVYQKRSATQIFVQVSGANEKGFSYTMTKQPSKNTPSNPNYDQALAEKLGGDDYGMKSYFLVILKTGTNTSTDKELVSKSFRGHINNIDRLVKEQKLIVAGPVAKNEKTYRGIFILNNIKTMEEAKEILQTDPAIANGLLDYEIFTWYGSAALPEYLPYSEKIWKSKP